jgi:hypothetical protein
VLTQCIKFTYLSYLLGSICFMQLAYAVVGEAPSFEWRVIIMMIPSPSDMTNDYRIGSASCFFKIC